MQLGVLLRDLLAPEQFAENVAVKQGSAERVEFALKLPGSKDETVWLPIDAKFRRRIFSACWRRASRLIQLLPILHSSSLNGG